MESAISTIQKVVSEGLENSMSYSNYESLVKELYQKGESTTKGGDESLLEYTKLNISRMKRLGKTTKLEAEVIEKVSSLKKTITWLVLSEGWCGDAAQNLPIINAIAEQNDNIELRIVLRDENPELMQAFLTNGNMAIPKLIQIENDEVSNTWGPRPSIATQMVVDYKAKHGSLTAEFKTELQLWYNKDKGQNTIEDILKMLNL